jgi:hypothetical protein
MKKIFFTVFILVIISCTDNYKETSQIATPQVLANDQIFRQTIQTASIISEKFRSSKSFHDSVKLKRISYLIANSEGEASYSELVKLMGYKDTNEFESINKPYHEKILKLKDQYGETLDEDMLSSAIKIVKASNTLDLKSDKINGSNARGDGPGCAGGQVCIRQAVDCKNNADNDFASGSWECATLGWIPIGWAVCQGTVNIGYAGDVSECDFNLTRCCGFLK